MYALLWRSLPGPTPVKALLAILLLAVTLVILFEWVFPAIAPLMPFNDTTVGDG